MKITDTQKGLLLASLLLLSWLIYQLAPILTPFLIGALLAYLGDPIVGRLERIGFSRSLAVLFVFCLIVAAATAIFIIILPLLQEQIAHLLLRIPDILDYLRTEYITPVTAFLGIEIADFTSIKQSIAGHWKEIAHFTGQLSERLYGSGQILVMWLGYLFIIPVVTFYLLRDWDRLIGRIIKMTPPLYRPALVKFGSECDAILSAFFRGQLLVMLSQAIIYSIGLSIVGVEFALLIGMLAGLVSFIPYLGFIVGFFVAALVAFFQFHEWIYIFYLLCIFSLGQLLESALLSPLLIGDKIGLHPVVVLFAVMVGGQLFGLFGMLLALPIAAVLTIILRYIHTNYYVGGSV